MTILYIIFIVAMQVDSFQQAIKHTQSKYRINRGWDYAWHYIYWLIDKPLFGVYGYFVVDYIVKNWLWFHDFWHYRPDHFAFATHLILGIMGWQLSYKLVWKPFFEIKN